LFFILVLSLPLHTVSDLQRAIRVCFQVGDRPRNLVAHFPSECCRVFISLRLCNVWTLDVLRSSQPDIVCLPFDRFDFFYLLSPIVCPSYHRVSRVFFSGSDLSSHLQIMELLYIFSY